jgi:multidrug efflux pump subunit AcrA (membrane-fusion protein)
VQVAFAMTLGGAAGGRITLPRAALPPDDAREGESAVLRVLEGDGTVAPRTVVVGIIGDDRVEIREGLAAGDRVVLPE